MQTAGFSVTAPDGECVSSVGADPASPMHDAAFDRAKTIVAYCASGGRSAPVGKTLKDMGYDKVRNLGGLKGWVDADGEVDKA
jgi:rhodanese-related sulfurtransferase